MTDYDYMRMALALALRAKGKTSPNPLVGAVIVKNNKVIAQGFHRRCGADHAEIVALKKAKEKARGATLYVTLEPCSHIGRTPPCVDAVIRNGIAKVVIGMIDPNPVNNGKSVARLRRAGIGVKVSFLQEELNKINESFIKFIKYKMPFVVVKWAQTLDGKMAARTGQSKWITSQKSRNYAHRLRNDFDAIMVGANTALRDNPRLNAADKKKRIKKIIADTYLKISLRENLFKGACPENIIVATTKKAPAKKINEFRKKGVNVIICPHVKAGVDLKWLFKELARQGITSVLIEGGSKIIGAAFKAKLVDKVLVFIAPKIMGDACALSSVSGLSIKNVNGAIRLKDLFLKEIDKDILIESYVHGNR
ncbi:MAG TPA: bifunctional diaminohydroxyphosphoribosylaminopyrimidine deaminase/5-amino-6-(5-phosphoribosylamino)uracil reductase RibD [Candidatus Omnitrophota bacterium]|nr:bifunctional diaminohydroxyphosphoribosylaminopyrimidine deaminase/5-amino-6-(5-phosphoribosylamino)uracil reductase RibD [Candidatus Omnitrophota bacterium]HPD85080.1 bifunctional diaminohydroxyphosphoribosylaminopyrimidine deaminase/5-amino-6-(5-phosphoribosylamino)uracil reductase RibD [Candidatus Omnitrophota bacterium]HRZ03938.1 bifunctional diaminohydroxyphosphoribosylaminopyrimidine deaminase/5-amino-6-(5-phosphoribosylamino)uracil reductase RibD [Candidatus Omnitrophota bacterium]